MIGIGVGTGGAIGGTVVLISGVIGSDGSADGTGF